MYDFPITGLNLGNQTFDIDGDWEAIFQKGKGRQCEVQSSTGNDGRYTVVTATHALGTTTIEVAEAIPDATVDGNIHWPMTAQLGTFQLGATALGDAVGRVTRHEYPTVTESLIMEAEINETQLITIIEQLLYYLRVPEKIHDFITILETFGKYPTTGYMGILGKIVLRMDVDSTDFCILVQETGQSVEINGVPGRTFLQVQQSKRSYDHGVAVYPGDAVMYSCPEDDPPLELDDIVKHDGLYYKIIAIQHAFFNGNIIYRESGLMKLRMNPMIWAVTGLIASANYDGKATLTWDEMDLDSLKHYEIWESLEPVTTDPIAQITNELDYCRIKLSSAYATGDYIAGQLATIANSAGNDREYVITGYRNDGYDKGEILIGELLSDTAPLGTMYNLKNHYLREKTKSNALSIKNLIPNTIYYYLVRAVDVYGTKGKWSNEAATATKPAGTRQVEGVR